MKKLIFAFALLISAVCLSCSGNECKCAADTTDTAVVTDSVAVDTTVDSVM